MTRLWQQVFSLLLLLLSRAESRVLQSWKKPFLVARRGWGTRVTERSRVVPWTTMTTNLYYINRGGAIQATPQVVVAQKKGNDDHAESSSPENSSSSSSTHTKSGKAAKEDNVEEASPVVGVKAHPNHKKSNAVGDPDGEGSDSEDDDDDDDEEDSDLEESDWEHFSPSSPEHLMEDLMLPDDPTEPQQVEVQVEVVQENTPSQKNTKKRESSPLLSSVRPGGGVGLRFGQRLQNHRRNQNNHNKNKTRSSSSASSDKRSVRQMELRQAWQEHIYMPPTTSFTRHLTEHARTLDGDSKLRLDRRTLYACLVLEWNQGTSDRKFLSPHTSQQLQAALSLATQPAWRKSLARPNAIRLYDELQKESATSKECTLAMQETIAMALVRDNFVVCMSRNIPSTFWFDPLEHLRLTLFLFSPACQ